MFIPYPNFFHLGSEIFSSRIRIKEFTVCILTQKNGIKLSEIWSELFIPDPDPDFLPIPDLGLKKAPVPGSGSVTLVFFKSLRPLWRTSKLQEKLSVLKRELQALQNVKFLSFLCFCWSFLPSLIQISRPNSMWIRIQNTALKRETYGRGDSKAK